MIYFCIFLFILIVLALVAYFYVINKVSDVRVNYDNLEKIEWGSILRGEKYIYYRQNIGT